MRAEHAVQGVANPPQLTVLQRVVHERWFAVIDVFFLLRSAVGCCRLLLVCDVIDEFLRAVDDRLRVAVPLRVRKHDDEFFRLHNGPQRVGRPQTARNLEIKAVRQRAALLLPVAEPTATTTRRSNNLRQKCVASKAPQLHLGLGIAVRDLPNGVLRHDHDKIVALNCQLVDNETVARAAIVIVVTAVAVHTRFKNFQAHIPRLLLVHSHEASHGRKRRDGSGHLDANQLLLVIAPHADGVRDLTVWNTRENHSVQLRVHVRVQLPSVVQREVDGRTLRSHNHHRRRQLAE